MRLPLATSIGEADCLASKFIAEFGPLSDSESFKTLYEEMKKKYPKADHYAYAYSLGPVSKSSDDGEPGGAAGRPMLEAFKNAEIDRCYCIVARYFGGTKLGIPRLRRSFLAALDAAMEKAKYGKEATYLKYEIDVPYPLFETIRALANRYGFSLTDIDYGISVKASLLTKEELPPIFSKNNIQPSILSIPTQVVIIEEEN